jgi:hypothetical protein
MEFQRQENLNPNLQHPIPNQALKALKTGGE